MIRILVLILLLVQNCKGCGSRIPLNRHFDDGVYTFDPPLTRQCMEIRSRIKENSILPNIVHQSCHNLVPGLEKIENGANPSYFSSGPRDLPPNYSKIIRFTCPPNGTLFRNFTVPDEVDYIQSDPTANTDIHIVSKQSLIRALRSDVALLDPENAYILYLPLLNLQLSDVNKTAAYLGVHVGSYKVHLYRNLNLSQDIMRDFHDLGASLLDHIDQYFQFQEKFGTHFTLAAECGGSIMVLFSRNQMVNLVSSTDIADATSITSLIHQANSLEAEEDKRLTIVSRGGFWDAQHNVSSWSHSVHGDPMPLRGTSIPIYEILDKFSKQKADNLKEMVNFETSHNVAKKFLFEIEIHGSINGLGKFLRNKVHEELRYICKSAELTKVVEEEVIGEKNFLLNDFEINCTIADWHDDHHIYTDSKYYNLLKGVCTDFGILGKCKTLFVKAPETIFCVKFFQENSCHSKGTNLIARTVSDIKKGLIQSKSMRLCTDEEMKIVVK